MQNINFSQLWGSDPSVGKGLATKIVTAIVNDVYSQDIQDYLQLRIDILMTEDGVLRVFKIQKYHAIYSWSYNSNKEKIIHTLCSRERPKISCIIEDYNKETMDFCKSCQKVIFKRIVNKLKGRSSF